MSCEGVRPSLRVHALVVFEGRRGSTETGRIVGSAGTNPGSAEWHAFMWEQGVGMIDLHPGNSALSNGLEMILP